MGNIIFPILSCLLYAQLPLTLCDPIDWSPPGSSVHGIFQARISEWVTISSSQGSSRPRDRTHTSCISYISRCFLYHGTTCDVYYAWLFTSSPAISLKSNNHNHHLTTKTPLFQNIWGHAYTHTHTHTPHTHTTHTPHTHTTHTPHTHTTLTHHTHHTHTSHTHITHLGIHTHHTHTYTHHTHHTYTTHTSHTHITHLGIHTPHTSPTPHTHTYTHSLPLLTLSEAATAYFYSLFLGRQPISCVFHLAGRKQSLVQCLSVQETLIKLSKHSSWSLSVSLMQGIATECPASTNPVKDGT